MNPVLYDAIYGHQGAVVMLEEYIEQHATENRRPCQPGNQCLTCEETRTLLLRLHDLKGRD